METTAIQARARKLWPEQTADGPILDAVRLAWADRRDEPFPASLAAWCQVMHDEPDADGDLELIACLRDAASLAAQAGGGLQPQVAELIVALLLLSFEHHVRRHAAGHAGVAELAGQLARIDEPLAAQVVAACLSGHGLLLMSASDAGDPEAEAANVIRGLSPESLMVRDGAAALRLEVDLALAALRPSAGQGSLRQRRQTARQGLRSVRGDAAVLVDVKAFEKRWHTGLLVVADDHLAAPALKDPQVCQYAWERLRVRVYRHGGSAGAAPTGDVAAHWDAVVANVAEPLREAIGVLFPRAPMAPSASRGQPQVFLSYAHEEDPALLKLVRDMLQVLVVQGQIRLWIDTHGIRTGQAFHPDIQAGIDGARVALVLVSNALLKSAYVHDHELPHILARRDAHCLTFCPLMLRDCDTGAVPDLTGLNFKFGTQPLESLDAAGRQALLAQVSKWLRDHLAGLAV